MNLLQGHVICVNGLERRRHLHGAASAPSYTSNGELLMLVVDRLLLVEGDDCIAIATP